MDKSAAIRALVKVAPVLTTDQETRLRALLTSRPRGQHTASSDTSR